MRKETVAEHIPEHKTATPANQQVYYTPQELADLWKCNISTVYDLLRRGKLVGFKLGRDWRITDEAVQTYEQAPENQGALTYQRTGKYTYPPAPTIMRVTW